MAENRPYKPVGIQMAKDRAMQVTLANGETVDIPSTETDLQVYVVFKMLTDPKNQDRI